MSFLFLTVLDGTQELARKIKRSDSKAFKAAFELFQLKLFSFLHYKLGDTAVAEDIVQDIFVKMIVKCII